MRKGLCKCGCGEIPPIAKRNRYNLGHIKGQHIDYLLGHKMRGVTGEKHFNYKKSEAGYSALHLRVQIARGKAEICINCESNYCVDWANLTGNYEDINDYIPLCRKCHNRFDDVARRVAFIKRQKYNLSEIARKGWETRRLLSFRGGGVNA